MLRGPSAKKASKPVFKTDVPFSATTWPQVAPNDHDAILDMLCNLLEPLGRHRSTHINPSKGRIRNRKRKRAASSPPPLPPPLPNISSYLTIGINSTARYLETFAATSAPKTLPPSEQASNSSDDTSSTSLSKSLSRSLALVVLPHPSPSSSLPHAQIPTLVYLSSLSESEKHSQPSPRLVLLSSSSETRLATALHLPRVGAIGIMEGASGAESLIEYAREKIAPVEIKWIEEARKAAWKGLNVVNTGACT